MPPVYAELTELSDGTLKQIRYPTSWKRSDSPCRSCYRKCKPRCSLRPWLSRWSCWRSHGSVSTFSHPRGALDAPDSRGRRARTDSCSPIRSACKRGSPQRRSGRWRPRKQPVKLHADKAYAPRQNRDELRRRGIIPRIARPGIDSSRRLGRFRWVVEHSQGVGGLNPPCSTET